MRNSKLTEIVIVNADLSKIETTLTLAMVGAFLPLRRLSEILVFGNSATVLVVTWINPRLVFDAATGVFIFGGYTSTHFSKLHSVGSDQNAIK
jgi:hypothetical protein